MHTKRIDAIEYLGARCVGCGSSERSSLEFDHIEPGEKYKKVSSLYKCNKIFWGEVKKCQLLCKACHLTKSFLNGDFGVVMTERFISPVGSHGITGYKKRKCRCEICCLAMRKREYRKLKSRKTRAEGEGIA